MKTLEELVKDGAEFASFYFKKHGEFPYCWYIQNDVGCFPLMLRNPPLDAKDMIAEAVKEILAEEKAESYVFMSEAWIVIADATKPPDLSIPPSQHPDRKEVLIVFGESHERTITGRFDIARDADGTPTLSEFKADKQGSLTLTGRFASLLGNKSTKH